MVADEAKWFSFVLLFQRMWLRNEVGGFSFFIKYCLSVSREMADYDSCSFIFVFNPPESPFF
jgi:hypothetical protein